MWKRLIGGTSAYAEDEVVSKPAEQLTAFSSTGTKDLVVSTPAAQLTALPSSQYQSTHLDKNTFPMKLCDLCSKLNVDLLSKHGHGYRNALEHQPGFTALETSVSTGCGMCSMFLQCVTKEYCAKSYSSPEEAHQVFRSVETHGKAPCLMQPHGGESTIYEIVYWIPDKNGDTKWINSNGTSAHFVLSNYRPGFEDERIYRTELAPMPDFNIARRWIEECTGNHQKCSNEHIGHQTAGSKDAVAKVPPLPTRVLDVGFGRGEEPRLLISGNRRAQYVTLSHCWGEVRPLATESLNLLQHLESIPLLSMPKSFQDAVIATRELGFQFLWIDCLCIIQDSSQDWERECSNMAHIYQNSALTICGSTASNSYAGFLHTRASPQPVPYHWEYRNSEGDDLKRATFRFAQRNNYSDTYPKNPWLTVEENVSPLQQRGWVLQEYLLSPRLLFFGLYRMYWECNTLTQFEDFPTAPVYSGRGLHCSGSGLHCSVGKATVMPFELSGESAQWKEWYLVVQEYSLRSITEPMDKLPALSGIADWLLGGRGDSYLVGLLKHALHAGLTWHIHPKSDPRPPVSGYRGPSWSWVSTDYPVTFSALHGRGRIRSNEDRKARQRKFESTSQQTKMQVHDAHVELRGQNLFGEVKSGSIKLRGRVKKGNILYQTEYFGHWFEVCDSSTSEKWIGDFYPDDLDRWFRFASEWQECSTPQTSLSWMSTTDEGEVECLCIDVFENGWLGLVIEPLPPSRSGFPFKMKEETYKPYRRIGALKQWSDFHWFEDGKWELIELF